MTNADRPLQAVNPQLIDRLGSAILESTDQDDRLALVGRTAEAETVVRDLLQQAVGRARLDGHSWAAIGARLGLSRQAVQQRFSGVREDESETELRRWLGPVTAFDEMPELEIAGRRGWHTVRAGMLRHLMVKTNTQWEHRRVVWSGLHHRFDSDGWVIGCRAFPWIYLIRDLGRPAESES